MLGFLSNLTTLLCQSFYCFNSMTPLQYFGTMQLESGELANAMLCIDADKHDIGILSLYGANNRPLLGLEVSISRSLESWEVAGQRVLFEHEKRSLVGDDEAFDEDWPYSDSLDMSRMSATLSLRAPSEGDPLPLLSGAWSSYAIFPEEPTVSRPLTLAPDSMASDVNAYPCRSWEDFKNWAAEVHEDGADAFRGHAQSEWKLETSLHRAGRTNLIRYCSETLSEFHGHLEANGIFIDRTKHDEFGRMVAIAQHHGFPTPLLDWTQSPYIAAWFAFSDALTLPYKTSPSSPVPCVRVYALTSDFLRDFGGEGIPAIDSLEPYARFVSVSPRENQRLYAQQGRFVVTNVGSLENYLVRTGAMFKKDYLLAADIPRSEALRALKDLRLMGLTAATMFPGIEGACRMLRQQMEMQRLSATPMPPLPSATPYPPSPLGAPVHTG